MTARYIVGDVFDALASLEPTSVDLVLTSPPFLALRSYLPPDHPTKVKEVGSEATPADYLDTMLDVVEACGPLLAPHGSLVFELGDTYSGSGGAGGDYGNPDKTNARRNAPAWTGSAGARRQSKFDDWPLDKSLVCVPALFQASLAYGRHLLRPERTTDPWRVRNLIPWCRPNPPVGALGDKFRPATSYLTVATKARDRYFDLEAVRGPRSPNAHARTAKGVSSRDRSGKSADRDGNWSSLPELEETAGAPPLDWWEIPTEPYKGSHYATWPRDLLVKPIEAMCPRRVCLVCGQPSRRIVETTNAVGHSGYIGVRVSDTPSAERVTLGWTDCGHDSWRAGVVLDPFAGSGTTLAVATGHGRDAIGIDLDERNADLASLRVGMFLTTETLEWRLAL